MKKILFYTFAMVFVLALGVAYAGDLSNGVTDFSGRNYDIGINPAEVPATSMEGVHAGGMREEGPGLVLYNGVTDFSGKTWEDRDITIEPAAIEGTHAGGMREEAPAKEFSNGVTDFSGRNYDIE
jgi:hypothetical protein